MSGWDVLSSLWVFEPTVILGCVAAAVVYTWATGLRERGRAVAFFLGLLLMLLALISPLDTLGDEILFSAHMVQHLLLMMVVPPLLLMGIPAHLFERVLARPRIDAIERALRNPVLALGLASAALGAWHLPALYNAALESEGIHVVQHLCFLVTATIFWWPVVSPLPERRFAPIGSMLYIYGAEVVAGLLSILITFAPAGLYPAYVHPEADPALVSLVRNTWGLSVGSDQQLAGLLMWVPGSIVYATAVMAVFARWHMGPDEDEADYEAERAILGTTEMNLQAQEVPR